MEAKDNSEHAGEEDLMPSADDDGPADTGADGQGSADEVIEDDPPPADVSSIG